MSDPKPHSVSLGEAFRVWLRIALLSFGGPAGQIAVMHRILVDEKRWIGEARFLHALNYCMLLPGPEAQQLATYIGWLMHKTLGGIMAGVLFIVPGLLAIMMLSWVYAVWGNVAIVAGLFFGLKAAVLAIVLQAVIRVGSRALRHRTMTLVAIAAFVAIFLFKLPFPMIVVMAGLSGLLGTRLGIPGFGPGSVHGSPGSNALSDVDSVLGDSLPAHARPTPKQSMAIASMWLALWLIPVIGLWLFLGADDIFTQIATFFSRMAVVTFGGAYAVLAYVAQQAVEVNGWVDPAEMLDGLAMAETTPGPLIMVTQFVGFMGGLRNPGSLDPLLAASLAGLLTTWVTFVPCFLWIFLGAPYVEALRDNRALAGALAAITAAVVGVILNLALWFALHTMFAQTRTIRLAGMVLDLPVIASASPWAIALAAFALVMVFVLRAGVFMTLAACASLGIALQWNGAIA